MLTDAELDLLRGRTDNPDTLKVIAALDRKREWIAKLAPIIEDTRVWPIVASIVETQEVKFIPNDNACSSEDIMGCKPDYYPPSKRARWKIGSYAKSNNVNGMRITDKGWDLAKPIVQQALDTLRVPFVANRGGLTCAVGDYRWECIWIVSDEVEVREFDSAHGSTGFAGSCSVELPYLSWFTLCDLPKRRELVKVDGMKTCRFCVRPRRDVPWSEIAERLEKVPWVMDKWRKDTRF